MNAKLQTFYKNKSEVLVFYFPTLECFSRSGNILLNSQTLKSHQLHSFRWSVQQLFNWAQFQSHSTFNNSLLENYVDINKQKYSEVQIKFIIEVLCLRICEKSVSSVVSVTITFQKQTIKCILNKWTKVSSNKQIMRKFKRTWFNKAQQKKIKRRRKKL